MNPLVSCIMPTYGRPAYVHEAVKMFLDQDYPEKELIVLNDCDGQRFEFDHPAVKVVNRESRYASIGEKRNAAIELSQGDLIAVWDDDDVHLPWRLSLSVDELQRLGTPIYRPSEYWAYWGTDNLHTNWTNPEWMHHGPLMFTRAIWKAAGGYPHMGVREDTEFCNRIAELSVDGFARTPIGRKDRFYVLRGLSDYHHMSMVGGKSALDTSPGVIMIEPKPIQDQRLCDQVDLQIGKRHQQLKIILFAPPRTGSSWLASRLDSVEGQRIFFEPFFPTIDVRREYNKDFVWGQVNDADTPAHFLRWAYDQMNESVVGCKTIMSNQHSLESVDELLDLHDLVLVGQRDPLEMAASICVAQSTGIWQKKDPKPNRRIRFRDDHKEDLARVFRSVRQHHEIFTRRGIQTIAFSPSHQPEKTLRQHGIRLGESKIQRCRPTNPTDHITNLSELDAWVKQLYGYEVLASIDDNVRIHVF